MSDLNVNRPEQKNSIMNLLFGKLSWNLLFIIVGVIILMIVFNVLSDGVFLSQRNITLLLRQSAILGIVAAGMVLIIVTGNIDLSVGSAVYLVSVVVAQLTVTYDFGIIPSIICALLVGLLMGSFQGLMVAKLNIPAFIVTLAGMLIFRGIGYVWSNALTIGPVPRQIVQISEGYIPPNISLMLIIVVTGLAIFISVRSALRLKEWENLRSKLWLKIVPIIILSLLSIWIFVGYKGIPMAVLVVAIGAMLLHFLMSNTKFGRNLYVIGGNKVAAKLSGVKVNQHLFISFVVMGLVYGIAGILISARLSSAPPSAGELLELEAIASAVIGGTSLSGGIGVIPGALIGALLLSAIDNYMSLMNVSSFLQQVVKGLILLAAVWFDISVRKKKK